MSSINSESDAIVIGGGVSGLAAAAFLARSGKKVRLFEQSHTLGGRAQTTHRNGFFLNLGPHALYRGGRGIEILRELGIEPKGRVPSVSGAFAIRNGVKHTFPAGTVSLLTTGLFGLSAKLEAARLLSSISKIDSNRFDGTSVREWLDQTLSHREVKDFVLAAFRVATYINAPELMSAGTALEQLKKAFETSVLYLDEGWETLVKSLRDAAVKSGVSIETGAKIKSVSRDASGAVESAITADRTVFRTPVVVVASSPLTAVSIIEHGDQTSLANWLDQSIPVKAACLDVALNRLARPKSNFALGVDRPLYLSVHSATAHLAPEGSALVHVAMYLSPDNDESPEQIERELESLLDLVQPGWRAAVVHRRFLPDMIVMNSLPLAAHNGAHGRPSPKVADVKGLYVAGDWVGSEGLLVDASLSSAKEAAALIAAEHSARVAAIA
jgi:phytoene dehydrogenase-like protein